MKISIITKAGAQPHMAAFQKLKGEFQMKIGHSIYSLYQAIRTGSITAADAVRRIAEYGADNIELVHFVAPMVDDEAQKRSVLDAVKECGLNISCYSIFADVLADSVEAYEAEIKRIYRHIDLAHEMGTGIMRSDLAQWGRPPEANTAACFERDLPRLTDACRRISDYAAKYGIIMTVENHGTYVNGSERVARLILAVDRENFRCTLDVGNCLCVDEDPMVCVKNLLPYAVNVHFKDFYVRRDPTACGAGGPARFEVAGWLTTNYGSFLRGAIIGYGDVDVVGLTKYIRGQGYGGPVAIEFEGMEDCLQASGICIDNLRRYLTL